MNELERLRYLVATGTATPQDMERLKTLLGQTGTTGEVAAAPKSVLDMPVTGIPMPWDQPRTMNIDGTPGTPLTTQPISGQLGIEGLAKDRTTGAQDVRGLSPANFATEDEYVQYINETTGGDAVTARERWREVNKAKTTPENMQGDMALPLLFPAGSNLQTELYTLGRSIGAGEGAKGRTLAGIAAGGAASLDIARNIAAGIGFEKRNRYVQDFYRDQQREQNFTPNTQSQGFNTVGGFEDGGEMDDDRPRRERPAMMLFPNKYGETNWFDQEMEDTGRPIENRNFLQSMQKTSEINQRIRNAVENVKAGSMDPQDLYYSQFSKLKPGALVVTDAYVPTSFEEGGEAAPQQQQVMQQVAGMLQQGTEPNAVVDMLIQKGVPEEQAIAIVQQVAAQMQGGESQEPQFQMKNGGVFNRKPGDTVTIKHKGQKKTITIKEITPDGQIIAK